MGGLALLCSSASQGPRIPDRWDSLFVAARHKLRPTVLGLRTRECRSFSVLHLKITFYNT